MENAKDLIIETLKTKASLKQDVFKKTRDVFKLFKIEAEKLVEELKTEMEQIDERVIIDFRDKGDYEFHIKFGGDILVFFMHTNVFDFDKNHPIWKTSYLKEDELKAYCGLINVYNFLADSFKYNRLNDLGYLVARFFLNKEDHYFVEGKRQLGFLYNDFINETINNDKIRNIIESSMLYSMDFDLLTPSYETMQNVSVHEVNEVTSAMSIKTGKRLGFKFEADNDII
ncbi:MAG: hypothetical protein P8Q14_01720 [Vicingaceae bacterium]|nr:hypothetical protein [Vicingaceae bacterium]